MKYQITKAASQDLDRILSYFQRYSLDGADQLFGNPYQDHRLRLIFG